jgi:hypothetical protein
LTIKFLAEQMKTYGSFSWIWLLYVHREIGPIMKNGEKIFLKSQG